MLKKISVLIILVFTIILTSQVYAEGTITSPSNVSSSCPTVISYNPKTGVYTQVSVTSLANTQIAGEKLNNPDDTTKYYVNGQVYTRASFLNSFGSQLKDLSCPPTIQGLQTLFLRILVIVNSIIGLVLFYVFAKAGFTRLTARSNPDAVKKSSSMIMSAITGLIIVLGAYVGLILIAERLLPPTDCTRFSFVESGRILFSFDQSDISPTLITDGSKPGCPTNPVNTASPSISTP